MRRPVAPAHGAVTAHLDQVDTIAKGFAAQYAGLIERDDAVQVARMALLRIADRIDPEQDPRAYVATTVRFALRRYMRDLAAIVRVPWRQRAEAPWGHASLDASDDDRAPLLDRLPSPEPELPADEADWLHDALDQLPAADAALMRLRFLQGLSLREIGRELGLSATTVQRIERRSLAALRKELEP